MKRDLFPRRFLAPAFCLICTLWNGSSAFAADFHLMVAPQTLRSDEVTLLWEKPDLALKGADFELFCDNRLVATTAKTHYTMRGLAPESAHTFSVRLKGEPQPAGLKPGEEVRIKTPAKETVVSIEKFGAVGDGKTLNTKAIQAAIDACPVNGVVEIPRGVFLSGALYLKSDMTLHLAADGVLKGSAVPADYAPMIRNRFEGWELETYASLINAGSIDRGDFPKIRHISIRGEGKISGGGNTLAQAIIATHGLRGRGRLICLMNAQDVEIQGLTLEEPPCWTLHYIYSENVTCHDLTINSNVRNGDGIDPDSSRNSYIFNCAFSTGDDCIAVKSGKNPEGNVVNRPTENVLIADCRFDRGHGISIGSEISGGIRGVRVEDCVAGKLLYGMQIKATKDRGAFVEDVVVRDCDLQMITILTDLPYNNDGQPASEQPYFRNFRFSHIDLTKADPARPIIVINGFPAAGHRTSHVTLTDLRLPAGARIQVDQAEDITFTAITTSDGSVPKYEVTRSDRVSF
jgi:polygalacturonase